MIFLLCSVFLAISLLLASISAWRVSISSSAAATCFSISAIFLLISATSASFLASLFFFSLNSAVYLLTSSSNCWIVLALVFSGSTINVTKTKIIVK